MSSNDTPEKTLSRAETIAIEREKRLSEQKLKAKAAKKAYLARPEIQEKLKLQKDKLRQRAAEQRQRIAMAKKAAKIQQKAALKESQKLTRESRQSARDQELIAHIVPASSLSDSETTVPAKCLETGRPSLTLIKGGRSSEP